MRNDIYINQISFLLFMAKCRWYKIFSLDCAPPTQKHHKHWRKPVRILRLSTLLHEIARGSHKFRFQNWIQNYLLRQNLRNEIKQQILLLHPKTLRFFCSHAKSQKAAKSLQNHCNKSTFFNITFLLAQNLRNDTKQDVLCRCDDNKKHAVVYSFCLVQYW